MLPAADVLVKLFVYGQLQQRYFPPPRSTLLNFDAVRGFCFDRGGDPALTLGSVGDPRSPWVEGELLSLPAIELEHLDLEEEPYVRRQVRTRGGVDAWAYLWEGRVPPDAMEITRWTP